VVEDLAEAERFLRREGARARDMAVEEILRQRITTAKAA
jgi:hypothetical protein